MKLQTVEQVIEVLASVIEHEKRVRTALLNPEEGLEGLEGLVLILAKEIKAIKTEVMKQRLLIEHEERVRTTRATRKPARKNVPLKFKVKDIVCRTKDVTQPGEVMKVVGDRIGVIFGDNFVWVDARSLTYYKKPK